MTRTRKPVWKYSFVNEEMANQFYEYAMNHYGSTILQHPQVDAIPDPLTVLVTGSGSLNYDLSLKSDLDKKFAILEE